MNPGTREEGEEVMGGELNASYGEVDAEMVSPEAWPVATVGRVHPADPSGDYFVLYPNEVDEYETETYHPESAPNVLTPEEARLIAHHLPPRTTGSDGKELCNRLSAWAQEADNA